MAISMKLSLGKTIMKLLVMRSEPGVLDETMGIHLGSKVRLSPSQESYG